MKELFILIFLSSNFLLNRKMKTREESPRFHISIFTFSHTYHILIFIQQISFYFIFVHRFSFIIRFSFITHHYICILHSSSWHVFSSTFHPFWSSILFSHSNHIAHHEYNPLFLGLSFKEFRPRGDFIQDFNVMAFITISLLTFQYSTYYFFEKFF